MDHDPRADDGRIGIDLLQIEARRITEFLRSDDSAFARAVRQVVDGLGENDNYAAHGSSPVL